MAGLVAAILAFAMPVYRARLCLKFGLPNKAATGFALALVGPDFAPPPSPAASGAAQSDREEEAMTFIQGIRRAALATAAIAAATLMPLAAEAQTTPATQGTIKIGVLHSLSGTM